ncbi:MAG TPA: transcriptional regulator, partial [Kiloniellaceae bacterium]
AGLVSFRRAGRSLIYAADFTAMGGLVAYLTENCCGERCPAPQRGATACKETTP